MIFQDFVSLGHYMNALSNPAEATAQVRTSTKAAPKGQLTKHHRKKNTLGTQPEIASAPKSDKTKPTYA